MDLIVNVPEAKLHKLRFRWPKYVNRIRNNVVQKKKKIYQVRSRRNIDRSLPLN